MVVLILKYLSQVFLLAGGVLSLWRESYVTTSMGKKRPTGVGYFTIIALATGFVLFIATDISERREKTQKEAAQQQVFFNQYLSEVEISFEPTAEQWSKIAEAYRSTNRIANMPVSYMDAPMIAERAPSGYWKIQFESINLTESRTRFNPVSTNEPLGKGFENVIRQAMLGFLIQWGDNVQTKLQPEANDDYPSLIAVSRNKIVYTLRRPLLVLRLDNLREKPTLVLRGGENYPSSIRFRSMDPLVEFDETIVMSWTKKDDDTFEAKVLPYISGPHLLKVKFKTVPA